MNWHPQCEAAINRQISEEYHAWYTYTSLAAYFRRSNVGLCRVADLMQERASEEHGHAVKLSDYQTMRGGKVQLRPITLDDDMGGVDNIEAQCDILRGFEIALKLELHVYKCLMELHKVADSHGDAQLAGYVESEFLEEQLKDIYWLECEIAKLQCMVGDGHGRFAYDQSVELADIKLK